MKPRIKRITMTNLSKGWQCTGSGCIGFGRTPREAYSAWKRRDISGGRYITIARGPTTYIMGEAK